MKSASSAYSSVYVPSTPAVALQVNVGVLLLINARSAGLMSSGIGGPAGSPISKYLVSEVVVLMPSLATTFQ